ncbi:MAG TPA: transporter substrate-binding domain-containing protein [Stellaceae bacterium]|nr:transporter substrate-binding domain-containing protein [Stellaceae bacterium]
MAEFRRRALACLLLAAAGLGAAPASARAETSPDAALTQLLAEAHRAATPDNCVQTGIDRLVRILCTGRIRVGVRAEYPLFAVHTGAARQGYEIDVAQAVGQKLGVAVDFVSVKAATRIAMLADDSVDVVIATMGDNTQRENQLRFIRPHYYRSETVLVGQRGRTVADWPDVRDRTVCATVGNGSNAELVSHGARLMLFDDAGMLPERLADQTCTLAAQDDSFFAYYFTVPNFAARFAATFGFAQTPWGMGVAREGSEDLARALDLTSQIFHRDGIFLAAAQANRIGTNFLVQQQAVWARPECNSDTGSANPACVLAAANAELQPTPFAGSVVRFETWFAGLTGFELVLPMLKTAPAWSLFLNGAANSLVLIAGALVSTLAFALLFGFAMGARSQLLRWLARAVTVALQSSPILLTLVITAAVMHALAPYSPAMALGAAIVALGLSNGSNAGQAISEAYLTLRAEHGHAPGGELDLFLRALNRSATQIVAFLVNAAKGTPIASFIGAPELLSALTDITSFSSGRGTTYTLLLVFYTSVVIAVVWLCRRFQGLLERSRVAT